jgi:hypothetical protein
VRCRGRAASGRTPRKWPRPQPGLIARLAAARGKALEHRLISAGGASLRQHWNAGEAQKAVQEGRYDRVVLQEQSTLPVKSPKRMHENVRLFDEAVKAAGSTTVLYMTWARLSAPESQRAIADAYTGIGEELGATVVPVGLAWQRFLRLHDRPVLHDRDQSHPTLAGSYLAACVFLAVLRRDGVQILLVVAPGHDPTTSGSCYFDVSDVEALRQEFLDAGASPGAIEVQEHGGRRLPPPSCYQSEPSTCPASGGSLQAMRQVLTLMFWDTERTPPSPRPTCMPPICAV